MHKIKNKLIRKKIKAFTLPELLVVLVIIGILVLLALPNLMPLITQAKSTEAKMQLGHVHTLQKSYFYMYSRYSEDLSEIGFEQQKLTTEGGTANYLITIEKAGSGGFVAKAKAVVDFDGDGVYNEWVINEQKELKEIVKD